MIKYINLKVISTGNIRMHGNTKVEEDACRYITNQISTLFFYFEPSLSLVYRQNLDIATVKLVLCNSFIKMFPPFYVGCFSLLCCQTHNLCQIKTNPFSGKHINLYWMSTIFANSVPECKRSTDTKFKINTSLILKNNWLLFGGRISFIQVSVPRAAGLK